ncbi:hypothetical protein [Streptomyces lydicus]|uniref:hypothetical protein n=1 Tax=Streptomyces lydicus TaxID=47763 RepID=UPI001013C31A|nr:hypothetical protein [Streptomyces lydicus]MCZ1012228.1 hypothetical protein [Streptomyces lydicus]
MIENEISGSANLHGVIVQAGAVNGGIHHHATAPSPPPAPHQLPPVPRHFTDREESHQALTEARGEGFRLAVISGIGGTGKTALASHWLRGQTLRDGQLYADLRGPAGSVDTPTVLRRWLRALGVHQPPADGEELIGLWRSVTANRQLAILIDNAASADQVRPLRPAGGVSVTVVTSRRTLWELMIDGAVLHPLGPLPPAAAVELLSQLAGRDRVAAEPRAASRLAEACGYLPLALSLAGARLASHPHRRLTASLDALTRHADTGPVRKDPARMAITTALDDSYEGLEAVGKRVWRHLGLLPTTDIDPDMTAAVCRLERAEASHLLETLADEHLLEPFATDAARPVRYRLGATVRAHARALAEQEDDEAVRTSVERRLCEWMLTIATQAQQRLTPSQATLRMQIADVASPPRDAVFDDDGGALAWLDSHQGNLFGVLQLAYMAEWDDLVWQLVDAYWPLFLRQHPYELWIKAHELGVAAARRIQNPAALRQMLNSGAIGLCSAELWQDAIAWYTESVQLAQEHGDVRDAGQALHGLGDCFLQSGEPLRAEQYARLAVTRWEECGYRRGVALATIVLGQIALAKGDPRTAGSHFRRAHTELLAVDDPFDASRALALLGHARVLDDVVERGLSELTTALRVLKERGSTLWQARTLEMLAGAYERRGDLEPARRCLQKGVELLAPIRPRDAQRLQQREQDLVRHGS